MALTPQEIYKRMTERRNLRKLYIVAKERVVTQAETITQLKTSLKELERKDKAKDEIIKDLQYQLRELQTMVFGTQKKAQAVLEDDDDTDDTPSPPRTKDSYRRPIPKPEDVTKIIHHRFPRDKHGNIRLRTYYVEDIPLATNKIVTKHVVEQYYDTKRRQWISKAWLPPATVILGDNVRVLIATLSTVERLSYRQVQGLLLSLFNIRVSEGEITKILAREATLLKPTRDTLLQSIQAESSHHLDESRYDVRGEPHYVWSITGGESGASVYQLGMSRGKGNAISLRGDSKGVLVSDDYAAYRYLAEQHQLCWAHLIRHFRDLATHTDFTEAELSSIQALYREIKAIYQATKAACRDPDPLRHQQPLTHRLTTVAEIHTTDPLPLRRQKTTLAKNIGKYFTCLSFPTIDLTNNPAERSLRHLVLKRKVSFGTHSHGGAEAMSTLFSVLLYLKRQNPLTYFLRYLELRGV